MTVSQLIEPNELLSRVRHNREILQCMVEAFQEELLTLKTDLRAGVAAGNCADLARWSHRVKGAASIFTTSGPVPMLQILEQNAEAGSMDGAQPIVEEICTLLDLLVQEANEIATDPTYWPDESGC